MLKYLLFCALIAIHMVWAKPVMHHQAELAPHIIIVTPQAQLQMDSLAHGNPFIQHLSPFTRFVSPHDETIFYVPTNAVASRSIASILPTYQYEARSLVDSSGRQLEGITEAIQQGPAAIQQGPAAIQQAAQQAAQAAGTINPGQGIDQITGAFPAVNSPCDILNPIASNSPQGLWDGITSAVGSIGQAAQPATGDNVDKDKLKPLDALTSSRKIQHIEYEIPVTPILSNEPRHQHFTGLYAPALPHVVDFIQAPVLLSPSIPTIKGRSLEIEKPIIAIPLPLAEPPKSEALPLSNDLPAIIEEEKEKKTEIGRFLEANSLKEESNENKKLLDKIKEEPEALLTLQQAEKQELTAPVLRSSPAINEQPLQANAA